MDLRILAIAAKDIKILVRDRQAFAMLLAMPIMLIVILSFALQSTFEEEPLAFDLPVIDYDEGAPSQRLIELLHETDGVTTLAKPATTEANLREQVRDGDYPAALIIPKGFAARIDGGETAKLSVLIDFGEAVSGSVASTVVDRAAQQLIADDLPLGRAAISVATEGATSGGSREPDVYEQNVPGFAILAGFFMTMFVAGSILAEKFLGTFRRLMATPVTRSQVLLGKVLGAFAVGFVQMMLLFAFGYVVFGLSLGSQPFGIVLVTLGVVSAATGLGVLIAGFARTDQQATAFGVLIVLTMAALGGSMVPRFIMPDTMQTIALITPHAWAIDGYHEIIVQRKGLLSVLPHTAALLTFAAIFFSIGAWCFTYRMTPD